MKPWTWSSTHPNGGTQMLTLWNPCIVFPTGSKLTKPTRNAKISLAMDDWIDQPIKARSFARVRPTAKHPNAPLAKGTKVRGFILGGLATKARSLQLQPTATAYLTPDRRAVQVVLCAKRSTAVWKVWRESPGRYNGTIRIGGQRVQAVEIPVELTIRAKRLNVAILALLVSLFGALFAALNARDAKVDQDKVEKRKRTHWFLIIAPLVSGLIAGLAAAFALYADDPTWGAQLGSDVAKLVTVTFAAATAGLTLTAPPARAARQKLAPA